MPLVLVVALALTLASIAAVNRSSSGVLGALFTTQSKEARETAESGLTEIIGTLNQRNNRGLLVSGVSPSSWGTVDNPVLQNPCNNKVDPTATAVAIGATGTKLAGGEADQRYYLRAISFTSVDGATGARSTRTFSRANSASSTFSASNSPTSPVFDPSNISLNGDRKGYLTLVVVGEVLRPGTNTVISSAEVRREFQVVPKCCERSFGSTYANPATPISDHGLDQRPCPSGFGLNPLVVGTDGDGSFVSKGNSFALNRPDSANPLPTIGTLNSNEDCNPATDCQITWGSNTTLLKPVNFDLPALPPAPAAVTGQACISGDVTLPYGGGVTPTTQAANTTITANTLCIDSTVAANQTVWQFQSNGIATTTGSGKSKVTTFTCSPATLTLGSALPVGAITVNASLANVALSTNGCYSQTSRTVQVPDPYCRFNSSAGRYDCVVRYINGNVSVKVDSTEYPVWVYLYDAAGTSPVAGGTVSFAGGGGISHTNCATYSASCSTTAAFAETSRFQMYGNIDGQNIDLRGNTNALAGFFYFPFADVELRGGGGTLNFSGIMWTNNLTLRGGVEFSLPSIADTNTILCGVYPNLCDNDPTNDNIRPQYDFVARSVSSTNLFN